MRRLLAPLSLLVLLAVLGAPGCDKVTPVAPVGATITLSINPTRIDAADEPAQITAIVRREDGTPVNTGTQVNFSTTLGVLDPEVASTDETGVAKSTLTGDGRIGVATVSATTGAAAEVTQDVQVGSVAASITLTATPSDVPKDPQGDEGVIELIALVRDDTGAPLEGSVVNFATDIGTLRSRGGPVVADELGQAMDVLTVTRNNISVLTEPFFEVRAETAIEGGSLIEDFVEIDIRGIAADITLQATPTTVATAGGTVDLLALVRDNLGDPLPGAAVNFLTDRGRLSSGGGAVVTDEAGEARDELTIEAADTAGLSGQTFNVRAQTAGFAGEILESTEEVRIQSLEAVASFTFNPASPGVGVTVNFRFNGTGQRPLTFTWNFGDGTPASSLENPSHAYAAQGTFTVVLTVDNAFTDPPSTVSAPITVVP